MTADQQSGDEAPRATRGRRVQVAAVLLGFLALVAVSASVFGASQRLREPPDDYRTLVIGPDSPLTVVASPASPDHPPYTVSSVVGSGVTVALSLPGMEAGTQMLFAFEAAGIDPVEGQAMRLTSSSTTPDGAPQAYITVGLFLDTGYHELMGLTPDGSVLWYEPPVRQLPSDLTPGFTWSGEGMTLGFAPYQQTGRVADSVRPTSPPGPVDDLSGCVDIETTLNQEIPGAETILSERRTTWCPDWGAVASLNVTDDVTTELADPRGVDWPSASFPPAVARPAGTVLPFPIPVTSLPYAPVPLSTGLVLVNSGLGDLIALTVREVTEEVADPGSALRWMQHPGGSVLGVATVDDRILVTTSQRALQSYDDLGRLLWETRMPDVAIGAPVIVEGIAVVALVDGTLRGFDVGTGDEEWTRRLSDVVISSPVASSGLAVSADSSGYVLAVDATGDVAWSGSLASVNDPLTALPDGSFLIAQSDGSLTLIEGDGRVRWSSILPDGSVNAPGMLVDGVILLPTDVGVRGLDAATGDIRWTLDAFTRATVGADGLVAGGDQVVRVSPDGQATVVAELREPNGDVPTRVFLVEMADEWAAMTSQGTMTFLGNADE